MKELPPEPPRWFDSGFATLLGLGLFIALVCLGIGGCCYLAK